MGHDLILVEPSRRSDRYIEPNIRSWTVREGDRQPAPASKDVVNSMQGSWPCAIGLLGQSVTILDSAQSIL